MAFRLMLAWWQYEQYYQLSARESLRGGQDSTCRCSLSPDRTSHGGACIVSPVAYHYACQAEESGALF